MENPRVAVVAPVHNRRALTCRFLESMRRLDYPAVRVVIVDDGSRDGTAEMVRRDFPEVTLLAGSGNLWWTRATNLGVRWALTHGFDYVLTINDDACVRPDFLSRLVACAQSNPGSIVGCRINLLAKPSHVFAAGGYTAWREGRTLEVHGHDVDEASVLASGPSPRPVEWLAGNGTLVPAACYRGIGLYDAANCPQYVADAEFVLRARRYGWRAIVALDAVIWNDLAHTWKMRDPLRMAFHPGSPMYWRPILSTSLRYCPRRYLLRVLWTQSRPIRHALAWLSFRTLRNVTPSFIRNGARPLLKFSFRTLRTVTPSPIRRLVRPLLNFVRSHSQ